MSVEAEKVLPQEQSAGPATLATAVVGIPGASDITEKAKPDGENKVDSNANQVAPIAAVVSKAADPLVGNDTTLISNDVGDKGVTSVASGESNLSTGAENAFSDLAQPPAEPIVAASAPAGGTGANGIVDKADTTIPVKPTEEVVPETTENPSQIVSDGKSTGDSIEVKNGNGTANGDVEMSEAPKEAAVTKDEAVKEASAPTPPPAPAPVPVLKGKRKAEDAFDDDEHDLSDKKAKVDNGVAIAATDTATHRTKKPGRPKKQQQQPQKPRKILTPVGRTLRKTRSQGPVEI